MGTIDDILNKDSVCKDIDELAETVAKNFDDIDTVVLLWQTKDDIHHRAYGAISEVVGLMEKAKFIMLREHIGDTRGGKG